MDNNSQNNIIQLPNSINDAIGNVVEPVSKNVGRTINNVFELIFGRFNNWAESKQKYYKRVDTFHIEVESNINNIPSENLQEPNIQIIGQSLQKAQFCLESDILRNMFATLIAASLDNRKSDTVHPCFADILSQMSPLDAQNIKLFNSRSTLPIAKIVITNKDTGVYKNIKDNIFLANPFEIDYNRQSISIASLSRVGIIEITYDEYLSEKDAYTQFYECELFKTIVTLESIRSGNTKVDIKPGIVHLTPLGTAFVKTVISD